MSSSTVEALDLAGLIHDLNNVLETISEAAELMASGHDPAELSAAIGRSVERGRRIVSSLGESGRSTTDLEDAVDRAAGHMRDTAAMLHGVDVQVTKLFEPGIRLPGAGPDWERVFMNLFLNAAQAMKRGGQIDIAASRSGGTVSIRVSDTGPGIPAGVLSRIFEPRFSTREHHSGLGLHVVHSIVQRYGGVVRAENRTQHAGARFVIEIPAPDAAAASTY